MNTHNPVFGIYRNTGSLYGTLQKGDRGEYSVWRAKAEVMTFSGDFQAHDVQVKNSHGRVVANTVLMSQDEYQVHVNAGTDVGLVILSLLAIDKCEISPEGRS